MTRTHLTCGYHYEYECRTDNLCWGSMLIGTYSTHDMAMCAGHNAGKGAFKVKRIRVKNN